jgi:hypothetical protein
MKIVADELKKSLNLEINREKWKSSLTNWKNRWRMYVSLIFADFRQSLIYSLISDLSMQTLQHLFDVIDMFDFWIIINYYVVYVCKIAIVQIIEKYVIHIMLIRCRFVAQIKWKHSIFINFEFDSERCQIFWLDIDYSNSMKSLTNVKLREVFRFAQMR